MRHAFLIALLLLACTPALAEDRMTGRPPGPRQSAEDQVTDSPQPAHKDQSAPKKSTRPGNNPSNNAANNDNGDTAPGPAAPPKSVTVNTPQPHTGKTMDRKSMESLGPLTNPLKGGLGEDMWAGSGRSVAQTFIPQLPAGTTLPPVQHLARRVLLTNGDVSMLKADGTVDPDADLFTLRLEKLLEMGAYADAVDLYTLIEGEPSHDRLARAGVMALMNDGYPAQACLEVRAAHRDKAETPDSAAFWSQMEAVCSFIQAESVKTLNDPSLGIRKPVDGIPGSKVLSTLVNRPDYRHVIANPRDLAELSDVERAVLRGLGRLDYTRLKLKKLYEIPAPVLMTMAGDPNLAPSLRLPLNIEAAERGIINDDALGAFYQAMAKQADPANPENGGTIYARYAAATAPAITDGERNGIVSGLLESYDGTWPTSLLPFAGMVSAINPANLSPRAVRTGLLLMLEDGLSPPERWVKAWLKNESRDSVKTYENILLYLANLVPENLPTDSIAFSTAQLQPVFESPEMPQSLAIYGIFSGLDRVEGIKDSANPEIYEKAIDLTVKSDYVMPVGSLVDRLRDASKNDRLGETVLLASVALNAYDPAKTHPAVVREVLRSLSNVGLKEEARDIALSIILGLKQ